MTWGQATATKFRAGAVIVFAAFFTLGGCRTAPAGEANLSVALGDTTSSSAPGPGIRPEVGGLHGAVVSSHPLASTVGLEVLREGGNAIDAVVTMAAVLAVVRPHMNGVGGDAFGLIFDAETRRISAFNGSGGAAAGAVPEFYRTQGLTRVPGSGPLSVTVPGAVAAWGSVLERHGTISFADALGPAISIAEEGFMVTRTLAEDIAGADQLNEGGQAIYYPNGRPAVAGDALRSPALAETLRTLAAEGPSALYGGDVGRSIAGFLEGLGSPLRLSDFAAHTTEWTDPISIEFQGRTVHTTRPNSQGIVLLQMLGMADGLDLDGYQPNSSELLHQLIEFKKLAFADRARWVADPATASVPMDGLLAPTYLRERRALVQDAASPGQSPGLGGPLAGAFATEGNGDTVFIIAVDRWGNAVSWIQSLFATFGSGLVDPQTGVVLQNRGSGFTLEEGHPNQVAPGKRPFHTLMATMVTDDQGDFEIAIGTPGGDVQPQAVAQVLIQLLPFDMSPQRAVEAPRFRSNSGLNLALEDRLPENVRSELEARGHAVELTSGWTAPFGGMQVIQRLPSGVLRTGADMRREATALAY